MAVPQTGIMKNTAVFGALISVACIYGGWALVAKTAMQEGADAIVFAFYRCLGGSMILFSAMMVAPNLACANATGLVEKVKGIPQVDLQRFAMLGVFMAANICGFILAVSKLSALTVSVWQPTIPVFTMIFSVIFGVEQMTKHKFAGVAFMVAGAFCVALFGETIATGGASDTASVIIGTLFVLLNTASTALYLTHNKDVVRTYEPVFATAMTYLFAAIVILACAVLKVGFDSNAWTLAGSSSAWLGLVYAICLTTALNYSLLAWANKESSPVITSCATPMQPMAAATLSLIILGIGFSAGQLIGAMFIIAGFGVVAHGQVQDANEKESLIAGDKA